MSVRKREQRMSEGKKRIITGLMEEYNIETAQDIQDALKDLLGDTIKEMMESEMDEVIGSNYYEHNINRQNYRNGTKPKKVKSNFGELEIKVHKIEIQNIIHQYFQKGKEIYQM